MEKRTAISVFNYYNVNPTKEEDLMRFDYRKIKKVRVNKKIFKGDFKMNTTVTTNNTHIPQMSFVEQELHRLKGEKERLKSSLGDNIITKQEYETNKSKKSQTKTVLEIIKKYENQLEIKKEIEDIEKAILNLEPFQVSADVGKYNSKTAYVLPGSGTFTTDIFASRAQRAEECRHDCGKKFFAGNELYSTSDSAKRVSDRNVVTNENKIEPMNNTKAHEYHRVLLLKALYRVYLATGRQVFNVGVGTSIDNYLEDGGARVYLTMLDEKLPQELQEKVDRSESSKEKNQIYRDYMAELESKHICKEFVVRETGGEPVTIVINDLYVAPETITGATKVKVDTSALAHAYVMDLGGLNESYLPLVNCSPKFDCVLTNKKGMSHKYEDIANWIVTKSSEITSMDRDGVEVILNNRDTMLEPRVEELIRDYMYTYFEEVTDKLKRSKVALKEGVSSLIFIGGGSQVLAPYIKEYYSKVCDMKGKVYIAESDGIFANVTGIYDAAKNYFDDRMFLKKSRENKAC